MALAGSYSVGDGGNCNNWYPYGYAYTDWSNQPSDASGSAHGELQHWTGTSWDTKSHVQATQQGSSYDLQVNNPYNVYSYGTGKWQEQDWHWGTFSSGVNYQYYSIWCG